MVIVLPMLLFFIYQVYNLIMISIRLKKAVAVEEAAQAKAASDGAAKSEAEAALAEARRMKEEAEALRAKVQKELEEAKAAKEDADRLN